MTLCIARVRSARTTVIELYATVNCDLCDIFFLQEGFFVSLRLPFLNSLVTFFLIKKNHFVK